MNYHIYKIECESSIIYQFSKLFIYTMEILHIFSTNNVIIFLFLPSNKQKEYATKIITNSS